MSQPTSAEFVWGKVGDTRLGELSSALGRRGWIRRIEPSTEYLLPAWLRVSGHDFAEESRPSSRRRICTWIESKTEPKSLELDPGDGEPRTLRHLGQKLASASRPCKPDRDELDQVVEKMLNAIHALHRVNVGAGLLQPDNVAYSASPAPEPGSDEPSSQVHHVILLDAGFAYLRGPLPSWLSGSEFQALWDADGEKMAAGDLDYSTLEEQSSSVGLDLPSIPDALCFARWDRDDVIQRDLRTAARLIAWLLDGEARATIPPRHAAPRAKAWTVLEQATRGEFLSAAAFRDQLQGDGRPSLHFIDRPPRPGAADASAKADRKRPKTRRLTTLAAIVALLSTAAALSIFRGVSADPKPRSIADWEEAVRQGKLPAVIDQARLIKDDLPNMTSGWREAGRDHLRKTVSAVAAEGRQFTANVKQRKVPVIRLAERQNRYDQWLIQAMTLRDGREPNNDEIDREADWRPWLKATVARLGLRSRYAFADGRSPAPPRNSAPSPKK